MEKYAYEELKANWTRVLISGENDNGEALYALAAATAHAVLSKLLDPQRKTAAGRDTVSNSGNSPVMLALKRGIQADLTSLSAIRDCMGRSSCLAFNPKGDIVRTVTDEHAEAAAARLIAGRLSDGMDSVHDAAEKLLEEAAEHFDGSDSWLDKPYTVRKLDKRVYIRLEDSVSWTEDETTPIQEAFRAVRDRIAKSRAVQTDPRNGYSYLSELVGNDGDEEVIYRRLARWSDIAGYAHNGADYASVVGAPAGYSAGDGLCTADAETARTEGALLASLGLTERQTAIVQLRRRGYGYDAISSYLGISTGNVYNTLKRIQQKCEKIGFTPNSSAE